MLLFFCSDISFFKAIIQDFWDIVDWLWSNRASKSSTVYDKYCKERDWIKKANWHVTGILLLLTLTLGMLWYHNPGQRLNCGVDRGWWVAGANNFKSVNGQKQENCMYHNCSELSKTYTKLFCRPTESLEDTPYEHNINNNINGFWWYIENTKTSILRR